MRSMASAFREAYATKYPKRAPPESREQSFTCSSQPGVLYQTPVKHHHKSIQSPSKGFDQTDKGVSKRIYAQKRHGQQKTRESKIPFLWTLLNYEQGQWKSYGCLGSFQNNAVGTALAALIWVLFKMSRICATRSSQAYQRQDNNVGVNIEDSCMVLSSQLDHLQFKPFLTP